jgi:hypothetical protein
MNDIENKNKVDESGDEVISEMTAEIVKNRYEEAREIKSALENFPGSTCEELMMLSGFCGNCFSRRMAWLKVNKLIYFDGGYYWSVSKNKD